MPKGSAKDPIEIEPRNHRKTHSVRKGSTRAGARAKLPPPDPGASAARRAARHHIASARRAAGAVPGCTPKGDKANLSAVSSPLIIA